MLINSFFAARRDVVMSSHIDWTTRRIDRGACCYVASRCEEAVGIPSGLIHNPQQKRLSSISTDRSPGANQYVFLASGDQLLLSLQS